MKHLSTTLRMIARQLKFKSRHQPRRPKFLAAASLVAIGVTMHSTAAFAVPRYVDSSGGIDAGTCVIAAAPCRTISFAISNASSNDVINLISLGGGQNIYKESGLMIPFDLYIRGISASQSIIDGDSNDRIFTVNGGDLMLDRVTLQNGLADPAAAQKGGAVLLVNGDLKVQRSILRKNHAQQGGAIAADNTAGTVSIRLSRLLGNTSTANGGGVHCDACDGVRIDRSFIEYNEAAVQGGAAFVQSSSLAIHRSRINHNLAVDGGAIFSNSAEVIINDSELIKNTADQGDGGGVFSAGDLSIQRSTLAYNSALDNGGAVHLFGNISFASSNSTYSANEATAGGALSLVGNAGFPIPNAHVSNSTFVDNVASFAGQGHHISGLSSSFRLDNSILYSSPALQAINPVCTAPVLTGAANLISDTTCNTGGAAFNFGNVSGLNTSLAANGGIGETHEISAASNAIDTAFPGLCINSLIGNALTLDQRRLARPVDGNFDGVAICDIGAFERQ